MGASRIAPLLAEAFRFTVAPPVTEWLEANIVIPKLMSPAKPGPFSSKVQPTSREILECWHPGSGVRSCVNVAGSQIMGKTAEGIFGSAYRMVHNPMPEFILGPSEDWLRKEISEKRLMALINANEVLAKLKPADPDRFRKMAMEMIGGPISIEGAGSDIATAGSTQGIVWIEEAAKIEHQEKDDVPEAHPIKLALERTKAFKGLEFVYWSFTANRSTHLAWEAYEAGSQTHFAVPCPHCSEYFPFEFELGKSDAVEEDLEAKLEESQQEARPEGYRSVVWSPDARDDRTGAWNEDRVRETAKYICPHNGCEIEEKDRRPMIAKYETFDKNENAAKSRKSFRRPSFYAPPVTFGDMGVEFLSRGDLLTSGLQNFYNSWLALPWEKLERNVKDEAVLECKAPQNSDIAYLKGTVPSWLEGMPIFLDADPGEKRTHWVAGAITREEEIWVIDYGTVLGIHDLNQLRMEAGWRVANKPGSLVRPRYGLCDSGDQTTEVYRMCQQSGGFWWPTKGSDATFGSYNRTTVRSHPGVVLYTYIDKTLKDETYDRRILRKTGPRIWLPSDAGYDLISGLSGQQRTNHNGISRWKKLPDDHYGDCVKGLVFLNWIIRANLI